MCPKVSKEALICSIHALIRSLLSIMQAFHHIPKPVGPNVSWPLVRMYHPLCTLVNPDTVWGEGVEEKQSVFVLWGRYGNELVEVADRAGFFTLDRDLRNVSWMDVSAVVGVYILVE